MTESAAVECADPTWPCKDLQVHAWDLGELVADWAIESGGQLAVHDRLADWLRLAGGLDAVEIDTGRFDRSLVMCGRAPEYEGARSDAVSAIQTEFTRLLYVWCAYEEFRRQARTDLVEKGEATDHACRDWLIDRWDGELPLHYRCALRGVRRLAAGSDSYRELARYTNPSPKYPEVILGLRVAGQLRHHLAHGRLVHPTPAEWGGRPDREIAVARGGTRLLLFSLQMLLATLTRHNGIEVEFRDPWEPGYVAVPLAEALLGVGLKLPDPADESE